jgi:hypothetical protein
MAPGKRFVVRHQHVASGLFATALSLLLAALDLAFLAGEHRPVNRKPNRSSMSTIPSGSVWTPFLLAASGTGRHHPPHDILDAPVQEQTT